MGCVSSEQTLHGPLKHINKDKVLNVATLNYCGILKSPFQFYSGNFHKELKKLSSIFETLKNKYVNVSKSQPFSWQFKSLDKRVKQQRYCSLYNLNVGIVDGKFISKETFTKLWHQALDKGLKECKYQVSTSEREEALQFDLLSFHTLLHYVYQVEDINQMENKDSKLYIQTLQPFFKQAFLDGSKKLSIFIEGLQSTVSDIIFIQEANAELIAALSQNKDYHLQISPDKDTLICVRKNSFHSFTSLQNLTQFTKEEISLLNWNGHSSILVVDRFILVSGHLDSNKQINDQNIEALKKGYKMLRQKHPSYEVICGADINSFLPEFDAKINIYPKDKQSYTSLKMRTSMQTQSNKAEVVSKQSKDKIMTTLPIISGEILTINLMTPTDDSYLPLDHHPFDHFLLFAKISKEAETNFE